MEIHLALLSHFWESHFTTNTSNIILGFVLKLRTCLQLSRLTVFQCYWWLYGTTHQHVSRLWASHRALIFHVWACCLSMLELLIGLNLAPHTFVRLMVTIPIALNSVVCVLQRPADLFKPRSSWSLSLAHKKPVYISRTLHPTPCQTVHTLLLCPSVAFIC